jgi:nucleosome binding factor SPN SPT16 subunit
MHVHPKKTKTPRDVQRQTQQMHAEKKGDPKEQSRVVEEEEQEQEQEERTSLVPSHKYRSFQETTDSETASELSNCE